MRSFRKRSVRWKSVLGVWAIFVVLCPISRSEDQPPAPQPPAPAPVPGGPSVPTQNQSTTMEQLSERLRAMEEMNRRLAEKLERTIVEHNEQVKQLNDRYDKLSNQLTTDKEGVGRLDNAGAGVVPPTDAGQPVEPSSPVPDYTEGQFAPFSPPPGYPLATPARGKRLPLGGTFGPGFQFETDDEEYRLKVHLESQIEARVWGQRDQVPGNSGIYLPRQRIFFDGNITKRIEYELSINRGLGGTVNILNAFINLHFDDRFQLRFGRFFTPFTYDQYAISNYWLPTPERSVFTTNVGLGRQVGLMGWGYLFDKRLDYAAGIFNGSRNSFESFNNSMDFVAFLNTRPFQESETLKFAKFLNLGTSVAFGHQDQPAVPVSFRIAGGGPNSENPGPGTTPFLILNPNVIERGDRLLGSVHAAYFYKSLSLIGEWQYGYGNYASLAHPSSVQVPFTGFYVTTGYFLTGEQVERRTRVKPLRSLAFLDGKGERGFGAWEVVSRVSMLRLGEKIFTSGFADPDLWSNQAITTELGLNWYWNEYVKIYTFWLHGDFAEPVQYRPGGFQKSADMFWLRFQLYF